MRAGKLSSFYTHPIATFLAVVLDLASMQVMTASVPPYYTKRHFNSANHIFFAALLLVYHRAITYPLKITIPESMSLYETELLNDSLMGFKENNTCVCRFDPAMRYYE